MSKSIDKSLDQARALSWALEKIYQAAEPQTRKKDIDLIIASCVAAGLDVVHVDREQGRLLPSDAHSHWFSGPGWYVDTVSANPITLPIGPFESADAAWREAYMAYALGGAL